MNSNLVYCHHFEFVKPCHPYGLNDDNMDDVLRMLMLLAIMMTILLDIIIMMLMVMAMMLMEMAIL